MALRRSKTKTETTDAPTSSVNRRKPVQIGSPRWLAPTMVACFVVGLLWIVAYYIAPEAPLLKDLSYWNVAIGFGLIAVGFILSTRWK